MSRIIRFPQAAKEFARVLKPGGKLFFVDSAQKGEVTSSPGLPAPCLAFARTRSALLVASPPN